MRPVFDEDGGASLGLLAAAEKRYTTLKNYTDQRPEKLGENAYHAFCHTDIFATKDITTLWARQIGSKITTINLHFSSSPTHSRNTSLVKVNYIKGRL